MLPLRAGIACAIVAAAPTHHHATGERSQGPIGAPSNRAPRDAPEVLRVEPPSWWVGHSLNPVRLLIRGRNLQGAAVASPGGGLVAGPARVNDTGTHAFLDVTIDPGAAPGRRELQVATRRGRARAPFEVLEPPSSDGRFQGFSPDDAIYLIMPDRFANGDPTNDDPPVSRGLLDRSRPRYYHGGDLQGVIDRLPYLKDLGVTALWLNPWYDNVNHLNTRETYDSQPITDYTATERRTSTPSTSTSATLPSSSSWWTPPTAWGSR